MSGLIRWRWIGTGRFALGRSFGRRRDAHGVVRHGETRPDDDRALWRPVAVSDIDVDEVDERPPERPGSTTWQEPTVHILMVDEDLGDVVAVSRSLRTGGVPHELKIADDTETALGVLFPHGSLAPLFAPDVILIGLHLRCENAFGLLRKIRASRWMAAVPVVILTRSARDGDPRRRYWLTANTCVEALAHLCDEIEELGEYWGISATLPPVA